MKLLATLIFLSGPFVLVWGYVSLYQTLRSRPLYRIPPGPPVQQRSLWRRFLCWLQLHQSSSPHHRVIYIEAGMGKAFIHHCDHCGVEFILDII